MTKLVIPDGVTSIGKYAFATCAGLTSVKIPDGVTSIGIDAFSGCAGLASVSLPDSLTYLSGFAGCTGLSSVTVPDGVTVIGENAFAGCSGLVSIVIPDSVTGVGEFGFYHCFALADVYYAGTEAQWNKIRLDYDNDPLFLADVHFSSAGPEPEHTPGDINGDGVVDTRDLIRLMKYASGAEEGADPAALDVNGDGGFDLKDLVRLMKYVAGADVEIY